MVLAQNQLLGAQAQATDLRIARAQDEHAIAMLTGQPPSAVEITTLKINGPPPPIPTVVPSVLLERRPDIAANERLVAAANANIGIAEAAYYPTLTLSANAGFLSTSLQTLFTWASRTWSAGPSVSETLFDFGRRGAQVQNVEAAYDDATVAAYRQTVLSAFEEVEDDLAALRYLAEESEQQAAAVAAAEKALALELDRYKAGTDSYLNVITTQTIALNDEQQSVGILQRRMTAAVDLVKAMGGGWDASTSSRAAPRCARWRWRIQRTRKKWLCRPIPRQAPARVPAPQKPPLPSGSKRAVSCRPGRLPMFDSLDEQLKKVEEHEASTKERVLRYLAIAAVSLLIFAGIVVAVQRFGS